MKHDLASTFVVFKPDQSAALVEVTPTVFEELNLRFAGFKGHALVSVFTFDSDWNTWERHPAGDELVCLLSGAAELVLDIGGRHEVSRLTQAGDFVLVPKGTWHTARTKRSARMLFVTPGEGTENKPV